MTDQPEESYECPVCGADVPRGVARCPKCGEEFDWNETEVSGGGELQSRVNSLLRRGIFFSVCWLAGLGSVYAIVLAGRAKKMIDLSGNQLTGMGRVWWCYIIGWLGIGFWGVIFLVMILRSIVG